MAALTIELLGEAGLLPTFVAATGGGDTVANSNEERTFLWVKNNSGVSVTVTVTAQKTTAGVKGFGTLPRGNIAVAIPAGQDRLIGPFSEAFNNAAGNVAVTYSAVTNVTIAAVRMPKVS